MNRSKATWGSAFFFFLLLLLVNPILTTRRFFMRIWTFGVHCCPFPRGPLALRPVLEDADWKWEVWRPRLASIVSRCLGDEQRCQTRHWLGLTLRPGGEKKLFFCSFFSLLSWVKESLFFFFCMKGPSSALLSPPTPPWCCCAPRFSLSLLSIRSYIDSFLRLKPADVCFFCLALLSSLSLGCWPGNLIREHHNIKNVLLSSLSNTSCYSKTTEGKPNLSPALSLPHTEPTSMSYGGHFAT